MNVDQHTRLSLSMKKRFKNIDLIMIERIDLLDKSFNRKFNLD